MLNFVVLNHNSQIFNIDSEDISVNDEFLETRSTKWISINTSKSKKPLFAFKSSPVLKSEKSSEILFEKSVDDILNVFHVDKKIGVFTRILNSEFKAIHRRLDEQNDKIVKGLKKCMIAVKTHGEFCFSDTIAMLEKMATAEKRIETEQNVHERKKP